uniref:Methyltransferase FkbM domain-containing protein n=1 Tax=Haptolina brevifila TaxID=156173 RepID=A0A7S2CIE2_9EUKA|mmetsp:Transcript_25056/g.50354  ORF Transcript_25056/g.50354 Transcript_25056/m.50354 type:complete len:167 (+) Transcript_25056:1134-1634(+)
MVDFPRFLQLLSERPPPSGGQLGKTVIKMDIESAEYTVIPSMIERGSLCNHVDFISVEWHARFAPIKFFDRHFGSSKSRDEAQQLGGMLRDMVSDSAYVCRWASILGTSGFWSVTPAVSLLSDRSGNRVPSLQACRTKGLKEIDDETYIHDLNDEQHENPKPFAVL